MTVPVVYLAHPVAGDVAANLAAAKRWLLWLMLREPRMAFCAPWIPIIEAAGSTEAGAITRERGLRDDVAMVRRCDGIVLCGPRITDGMRLEIDAIRREDCTWCADLTGYDAEEIDVICALSMSPERSSPIAWGRARFDARPGPRSRP